MLERLDEALLGQHELHRLVLVGVLSRGHMLIEGMPGLGKTALINILGQLLDLEFKRIQFTPDLMPSDVIGGAILQQHTDGHREMVFQQGPIFTNILLADEINRASPKTQSALLEAMQERRVTTLGQTRGLPSPFFVLASQNPIELEGTYPLPEAQLDRFLFKLTTHPPAPEILEEIVAGRRHGTPPRFDPVLHADDLQELFGIVDSVVLPRPVARYIARLVAATHPTSDEAPESVKRFVRYGASPRAAIGLGEASRAIALISGRGTVGFEDVRAVAPATLHHRLIMGYEATIAGETAESVARALVQELDEVVDLLPKGVRVASPEPKHA